MSDECQKFSSRDFDKTVFSVGCFKDLGALTKTLLKLHIRSFALLHKRTVEKHSRIRKQFFCFLLKQNEGPRAMDSIEAAIRNPDFCIVKVVEKLKWEPCRRHSEDLLIYVLVRGIVANSATVLGQVYSEFA